MNLLKRLSNLWKLSALEPKDLEVKGPTVTKKLRKAIIIKKQEPIEEFLHENQTLR